MLLDGGLVLEGGGTRCLFTAGILDYLMEHDIYFTDVYSVSASAYVAINYISKQVKRTKRSFLDYSKTEKIISVRSFLKTGCIYNIDLLFNRLPNEIMPFDYDSFFNSDQRLTMSLTDLKTGDPVYINKYEGREHLMDMCCSSNSFPIISRTRFLDGRPMTDGGMADAIPIRKAVADRCKKMVVILTQQNRYRKKLKTSKLITTRYFWHRNFVRTIKERPYKYNADLDYVEKLTEEGKAIAYYPEINPPPLICFNNERLEKFYEHGYEFGKRVLDGIIEFFGLNPGEFHGKNIDGAAVRQFKN